MAYTFSEELLSDLHKDARGHRPQTWFWDTWKGANDDRKQAIWDMLLRELDEELEREARAKAAAVENYEAAIKANMELGARDRETAKRWFVQSLLLDAWDLRYGGEKVCYELGLPFEMAKEFDEICKELREELEEDENVY